MASSLPQPTISTLFPYTTLFRSGLMPLPQYQVGPASITLPLHQTRTHIGKPGVRQHRSGLLRVQPVYRPGQPTDRSEEHTSELQSREKLVCRLLLEKKKNSTFRK